MKCNKSVWLELAKQRKTRLKSGYKRVIINLDFFFPSKPYRANGEGGGSISLLPLQH